MHSIFEDSTGLWVGDEHDGLSYRIKYEDVDRLVGLDDDPSDVEDLITAATDVVEGLPSQEAVIASHDGHEWTGLENFGVLV